MAPASFPRRSTSGCILVGYVATDFGKDALRLGIALAKERNVRLELVMVAPAHSSFSGVYPHERGYDSIVEEQIAGWLEEALAEVPEEITATARIVTGDSEAAALCETAETLGADLLVVGARQGGLFGRFQMALRLTHYCTLPPFPSRLPRGDTLTQALSLESRPSSVLAAAPPMSSRSALIVRVAVRFPCVLSRSF